MVVACRFPRCVAMATEPREYCPVHDPISVVMRAQRVVASRIGAMIESHPRQQRLLEDLLNQISGDLQDTV